MNVYIDMDSEVNIGEGSGNSFKPSTATKMKYSEFLDKMSSNSIGVTMKDSHSAYNTLKYDIVSPEFFSEISDLAGADII